MTFSREFIWSLAVIWSCWSVIERLILINPSDRCVVQRSLKVERNTFIGSITLLSKMSEAIFPFFFSTLSSFYSVFVVHSKLCVLKSSLVYCCRRTDSTSRIVLTVSLRVIFSYLVLLLVGVHLGRRESLLLVVVRFFLVNPSG